MDLNVQIWRSTNTKLERKIRLIKQRQNWSENRELQHQLTALLKTAPKIANFQTSRKYHNFLNQTRNQKKKNEETKFLAFEFQEN